MKPRITIDFVDVILVLVELIGIGFNAWNHNLIAAGIWIIAFIFTICACVFSKKGILFQELSIAAIFATLIANYF